MVQNKLHPSASPIFKDVGGGKTEKQNAKFVYGVIVDKLGGCEGARARAVAALIAGIYMKTMVEAASVPVRNDRMPKNVSLGLIWARDCRRQRMEKGYDFPISR